MVSFADDNQHSFSFILKWQNESIADVNKYRYIAGQNNLFSRYRQGLVWKSFIKKISPKAQNMFVCVT